MACVYILYSVKRDRYYIGSTNNIERRLAEHNTGLTSSTRTGKPWILCFAHEVELLSDARRLENKIKSWKDRRIIERIIGNQKLEVG